MIRAIGAGVIGLVLALSSNAAETDPTATPESRGLAIAREAKRRDLGFGNTVAQVTMQLTATGGRVRTRELTWQIFEIKDADEGDRSLTVFQEPRDIRGTGFLSYTHIGRADDQWLYLPALKRVKRISSTNKSSSFVGSEFSYEDLLSDEVEKFDYRWLRDESCGEWQCFVLQRKPLYANSGYSKQLVWLDQAEYRLVRVDYYDHRDRLEKKLMLGDYRKYLDQFWRAHTLTMEGKQTGRKTVLQFGEYAFQTGLTLQAFTPSALKRLR